MILGHVWIDTNDLSADAFTVLKLELNDPAVVGNNIQRVQLTTSVCGVPNESRLSCGALKKDSFHNLRAPSASSAC